MGRGVESDVTSRLNACARDFPVNLKREMTTGVPSNDVL